MALVFVAFLIKMAAAPFHMWAPDAYSGAPTPTTGFLSGAGKIAGVAALFRLFGGPFATPELSGGLAGWTTLAFFAALASIVVGNLVALTQKRVRRMLAWSSVAHAGYLLLALCALGVQEAAAGSIRAVILYGAAYSVATAGAFVVLGAFGRDQAEVETLDELSGLGRKHPAMGLALSLFLISAAGLPPAAGFVAKLSLFSTAFAAGEGAATPASCAEMMQWLAVGGLVLSVAGGLAYLRVIAHLYGRDPHVRVDYRPHTATTLAVGLAAFLTLWMGLMPGRVLVWGDNVAKQLLPAVAAAPVEPAPAAPADAAPAAAPAEAQKAIEVVPLPNAELPR
jgi:NADH-quinone oxidoreductase subunit N